MLLLPLPLWLRVPVCLYVTSVKLSGSQAKVNSPALGSGVTGSRDVFPQEPRDPWRLQAGAREGLRGEDDPLSCPPQEHWLVSLFSSLSTSCPFPFYLVPPHHLHLYGSFIRSLSASVYTKLFNSISFSLIQSFVRAVTHLCSNTLNVSHLYIMQYKGDIKIIN